MKITVNYKSKTFGFDNQIYEYGVEIEEFYSFVELRFRGSGWGRGKSFDDCAQVMGGDLFMSQKAARKLATALLKFLNQKGKTKRKRKLKIVEMS